MQFGLERSVHGSVSFRITEVFPDLLFDECARCGVRIKNIRKTADHLLCEVTNREKKTFLAAVAAVGGNAEVLSEYGLPVFFRKYRARYGIPAGIVLFLILYFLLAGIVWSVDVEGTQTVDADKFLLYMAENRIKKGVFSASVDCGEAEYIAEQFSEAIEKATVNLVGCRIFIRIRERSMPPKIKNEKLYCNVVAAKDGEVLSVDVLSGTPEVREGDAVVRGQLLAGGITVLSDGSVRYSQASAVVIARTRTVVNAAVPETLSVMKVGKIRKRILPFLFVSFSGALPAEDSSKVYVSSVGTRLHGTYLPIGYEKIRKVSLSESTIRPGEKELFLLCFNAYALLSADRLRSTEVESRWEEIRPGRGVAIEGISVCTEDICSREYFEIISE